MKQSNNIKLHLGNGTVYLDGYTNIDINAELTCNRPDLVKQNRTTIDKYFKFPFGENIDNKVTDLLMDIRDLSDFKDNTVDEILLVNVISHIKKSELLEALKEWHRILKPEGLLIIDNCDRQKQAQLLIDAKTFEEYEWALRLIYCHQRSCYDIHFWGYCPDYAKMFLENTGLFKYVWTKNDYIEHDITDNFQICVKKI